MRLRNPVLLAMFAATLSGTAVAADVQLPSNLPHRKPGLWVQQIARPGKPAVTEKICLDEATDAALYKFGIGASNAMCNRMDIRMHGNEMVVDSVCTVPRFLGHGGNTMTGHGVTHFSGNTAYHTEQATHYDPPLNGKTDDTTSIDARWTGPCEAGQKPGDIVLPNGMTVNVQNASTPGSMMKNVLKGLMGHHG